MNDTTNISIPNLRDLTNETLIAKIKNLAAIERKLTQTMILHIAEMDRRKLYLGLAYSSLFEYLTKEIGYSEGAAQRRIDAARLFQPIPALADKIESGSIKYRKFRICKKFVDKSKKKLVKAFLHRCDKIF